MRHTYNMRSHIYQPCLYSLLDFDNDGCENVHLMCLHSSALSTLWPFHDYMSPILQLTWIDIFRFSSYRLALICLTFPQNLWQCFPAQGLTNKFAHSLFYQWRITTNCYTAVSVIHNGLPLTYQRKSNWKRRRGACLRVLHCFQSATDIHGAPEPLSLYCSFNKETW